MQVLSPAAVIVLVPVHFTVRAMFYLPLPFQFYFPPQFFSFSLLYNFIIFPPQCFYSLLHNFLLFSFLNVFYSPPPQF